MLTQETIKTSHLLEALATRLRSRAYFLVPAPVLEKCFSMLTEIYEFAHIEQDAKELIVHDILTLDLSNIRKFGPDDVIIILIPSFRDFKAFALMKYSESLVSDPDESGYWKHYASLMIGGFNSLYHSVIAHLHLHLIGVSAKQEYLSKCRSNPSLIDAPVCSSLKDRVFIVPVSGVEDVLRYVRNEIDDLVVMPPRKGTVRNGPRKIQKSRSFSHLRKTQGGDNV